MKTFNPTKSLGILAGVAALAGAPWSGTAQSLLDQWNFNETSGTTAANSVGGGASATLMGQAAFNGSGGVTLNGTSGTYISMGSGLLTGVTAVTFEGWFSFSVPNNNVHLFSLDNGAGTGGDYLRFNIYDTGNGNGGTNYMEENGSPVNKLLGNQVLPQNQLLNIAVIYDPANNYEAIYLNGALESSYTGTLPALTTVPENLFTLGKSPWSAYGDPGLNGTIDQFSIYNGALQGSQIASDFAAGPAPVPEPSSIALGAGGLMLVGWLRRRSTR
jgi:hypothetical protein